VKFSLWELEVLEVRDALTRGNDRRRRETYESAVEG